MYLAVVIKYRDNFSIENLKNFGAICLDCSFLFEESIQILYLKSISSLLRMHFTLPQISAIIAPLIIALIIILLWYKRDCQTDQRENQENLATLISVFFWAAFGGLMLKLFIDTIYHFDNNQIFLSAGWFYVLTVLLEEIIKGGSLIVGLEMAEQKFNEISDGIVYGAMAALGFLFFENIFYLLSTNSSAEFFNVLGVRYLSTFGIHLLTTSIFGLTYAKAYLGYKKRIKLYKKQFKITEKELPIPKPYDVFHHFKYIITKGNSFLNIFKLMICFDLLRALYFILSKQENKIVTKERFLVFPSIFIVEGFLLGFYLHLICNVLLQNEFLGWLLLTIMPVFSFVLYLGFYRFDQK